MNSSLGAHQAGRLLADLSWTKRLAASLVGAAGAEDVAQDAWLSAVRRGSESWPPSRPWLSGTVRRLSARWWRTAARRAAREQFAAREEALPSTAELVARNEQQQRIARLTLTLEEPLRTTLLLRYQEGLDTNEIARRQATPVDTVRWRLRKALSLLRNQLESDQGSDWRSALLPLAWPTLGSLHPLETLIANSASVPITIGGVVMSSKLTAAVLGFGAILVAVFLWQVDPGSAPSNLETEVAHSSELALPTSAADSAKTREPSLTQDEARLALSPVPAAANKDEVVFVGRVVDERGSPLEGIDVFFPWPKDFPGTETATDANGEYRIVLPDATKESLWLQIGSDPFRTLKGYTLQRVPDRETSVAFVQGVNDLGTAVLVRAGVITGRVIRQDGQTVVSPFLTIKQRDGDNYPGAGGHGWGNETGVFTIGHLLPGEWSIDAQHYGSQVTAISIEIRAGETETVQFLVSPSPTISGTVLTTSGVPIEGVTVKGGHGYNFPWGATTSVDGHFEVALARDQPAGMSFQLEGWIAVDAPTVPVVAGTSGFVVHMEELPELRLRVLDPRTEEPIESYELVVSVNREPWESFTREVMLHGPTQSRHTVNDPEGLVLVRAREGVDEVEIKVGAAPWKALMVTYDVDVPGTMTVLIDRGASVAGRVTWKGAPVADADVRVHELAVHSANPLIYQGQEIEPYSIARKGQPTLEDAEPTGGLVTALDPHLPAAYLTGSSRLARGRTRTRADGSFELHGIPATSTVVIAVRPPATLTQAGSLRSATLDLSTDSDVRLGDMELLPASHIRGRVDLREAGYPSGLSIACWVGDWIVSTTDAHGHFDLGGLPPGDHLLRVQASNPLIAEEAFFAVHLNAGETREVALLLENDSVAEIELKLLMNGGPVRNSRVYLDLVDKAESGQKDKYRAPGGTDSNGELHLSLPGESPRTICFMLGGNGIVVPTARVAQSSGTSSRTVDVQAGALRIEHAWPATGTLNVNLTLMEDLESTSTCWFRVHPDGLRDREGILYSDASGALVIPALPAGRGGLVFILKSESGNLVKTPTIEIKQGETTTLKL